MRLAPHLFLAAQDHAWTASDIARRLVDTARPRVSLTKEQAEYVSRRLATITLKPSAHGNEYVTYSHKLGVYHTEAGAAATQLGALLAGQWLTNRAFSEQLLPQSLTRRLHHGVRLAIAQFCDTKPATKASVGHTFNMLPLTVGSHLHKLVRQGVLETTNTHPARYSLASNTRSDVINLIQTIHSLRDPAYANHVQHTIIPDIVESPALYGQLAHAAIEDFMTTWRNAKLANNR